MNLCNCQAVSVLQHIGQFCKPHDSLAALERKALHKVLRFATNSLSTASYLDLASLGGPLLSSAVCTVHAAMVASSIRFKAVWEAWLPQLHQTALQHGALSEIPICDATLSPSFWDSCPLVLNLCNAFEGHPHGSSWSAAIQETKHELLRRSGGQTLSQQSLRKVEVRKIAYVTMLKHIFPSDLIRVLQRRLQKILNVPDVEELLNSALPFLKQLQRFEIVQVLKTWSNSWSTSHRYHEERRFPCLFGCPGQQDDLTHYAFCSNIHCIICRCVSQPESWNECHNLGIANPSRIGLRCIACTFYVYHAVKFHPSIMCSL